MRAVNASPWQDQGYFIKSTTGASLQDPSGGNARWQYGNGTWENLKFTLSTLDPNKR